MLLLDQGTVFLGSARGCGFKNVHAVHPKVLERDNRPNILLTSIFHQKNIDTFFCFLHWWLCRPAPVPWIPGRGAARTAVDGREGKWWGFFVLSLAQAFGLMVYMKSISVFLLQVCQNISAGAWSQPTIIEEKDQYYSRLYTPVLSIDIRFAMPARSRRQKISQLEHATVLVNRLSKKLMSPQHQHRMQTTNRLIPQGSLKRRCVKEIFQGWVHKSFRGCGRILTKKLVTLVTRRLRLKLELPDCHDISSEASRLQYLLKVARKRLKPKPKSKHMSNVDNMDTLLLACEDEHPTPAEMGVVELQDCTLPNVGEPTSSVLVSNSRICSFKQPFYAGWRMGTKYHHQGGFGYWRSYLVDADWGSWLKILIKMCVSFFLWLQISPLPQPGCINFQEEQPEGADPELPRHDDALGLESRDLAPSSPVPR